MPSGSLRSAVSGLAKCGGSAGATSTSRRTHFRLALAAPGRNPEGPEEQSGQADGRGGPQLRRLLVAWRLRSGHSGPEEYVISTTDGKPVSERNLRRVLTAAKTAAGLDGVDGRFSWHSLRHSAGSVWLTEYGLPVTTVSKMLGHATPSFTLACYGRDPRDQQTVVADVLARAEAAGLGR